MAEIVGLAASVIQIAGAGAKLSTALYNFTSSAVRADQDIRDIAGDVELTSNALESVGTVFGTEEAKTIVSKKAIQDARNIIRRCQEVFNEVSEMIEKGRKSGKDGKKSLGMMGKLAWPMKESRVELQRRRLESLKNSLILLLHVIQLARGNNEGKLEKGVIEEEREKIRQLHERQEQSLKALQYLEIRFSDIGVDDEDTLQGSTTISQSSTLCSEPTMGIPPPYKTDTRASANRNMAMDDPLLGDDNKTCESDTTATASYGGYLTSEDLIDCAKHVQDLLEHITKLQDHLKLRESNGFPEPKKKEQQKMSLGDFLGDQSLGSWADEMEDVAQVLNPAQALHKKRPRRGAGSPQTSLSETPTGPLRFNGKKRAISGSESEPDSSGHEMGPNKKTRLDITTESNRMEGVDQRSRSNRDGVQYNKDIVDVLLAQWTLPAH
ncbi:Nn.00g105690.m01.CDS01 [Neocucurbitaria sp. VM-36]